MLISIGLCLLDMLKYVSPVIPVVARILGNHVADGGIRCRMTVNATGLIIMSPCSFISGGRRSFGIIWGVTIADRSSIKRTFRYD